MKFFAVKKLKDELDIYDKIQSFSNIDANEKGNDLWWVDEQMLQTILDIKVPNNPQLQTKMKQAMRTDDSIGRTLYCVYIGLPDSRPVQKRIKNHLTGTRDNSTLRDTLYEILSITNPDQKNEKAIINQGLNQMYVSYLIGNKQTSITDATAQFFYILRDKDNVHPLAKLIRK